MPVLSLKLTGGLKSGILMMLNLCDTPGPKAAIRMLIPKDFFIFPEEHSGSEVCSFLSFFSIPTAGQVVGLYSRFDVIVSVCGDTYGGGGAVLQGGCGMGTNGTTLCKCVRVHSPGCSLSDEVDARLFSLSQHLAAQQTYNHLDMSVGEALRQRTLCLEGVLSCQPHESLGEVIDRIAREQVPCTLLGTPLTQMA